MTQDQAQTRVDELRTAAEGLERQAAAEDTNATSAPQQQQGNHAQNAARLRTLREQTLAEADEIERKYLRGHDGPAPRRFPPDEIPA